VWWKVMSMDMMSMDILKGWQVWGSRANFLAGRYLEC